MRAPSRLQSANMFEDRSLPDQAAARGPLQIVDPEVQAVPHDGLRARRARASPRDTDPAGHRVRSTAPSRPTHATDILPGWRARRRPYRFATPPASCGFRSRRRSRRCRARTCRRWCEPDCVGVERGGPDSPGHVPDQDAAGRTLADIEDWACQLASRAGHSATRGSPGRTSPCRCSVPRPGTGSHGLRATVPGRCGRSLCRRRLAWSATRACPRRWNPHQTRAQRRRVDDRVVVVPHPAVADRRVGHRDRRAARRPRL